MKRRVVTDARTVAEAFDVHLDTVHLWARNGMPRTKISKMRYQYDIDEIFLWKLERENGRVDGEILDPMDTTNSLVIGELKDKVEKFRIKRAEVFAAKQMKNLEQQERIRQIKLADLSDDDIRAMDDKIAQQWYGKLGVDTAIFYDKEEIERSKGVDDVNKVLDAIMKIKEIQGGSKPGDR